MSIDRTDIQKSFKLIEQEGIKVSYFHTLGSSDLLECFHSESPKYTTDYQYSLFEIPSLARILAQKADVLTPVLRLSIAINSQSELCCVLEWTPKIKRVMTFQFSPTNQYSEKNLALIFKDRRELESVFFSKLSRKLKVHVE